MISSVPMAFSHSKRSLLIPSGRMAIALQASSAQSKAPPRQKLPVDGQTAFWVEGSNSPETRRGTRHPNPAPTLWAPVGKYLPISPMIRALTPVSSGGNSSQLPVIEEAALFLRLVLPGDAEEVQGVDVPEPHIGEAPLDLVGNVGRIPLLGEGGDDDVPLAAEADGLLQDGLVDTLDHAHFRTPQAKIRDFPRISGARSRSLMS